MDCPTCKNPMITLELNDVEIDYCVDCGGIWLDKGELELLLGDSEQAKLLLNSFRIDPSCVEKPRKCPICDKKMDKVLVGTNTETVLIDRCVRGDGLWFDSGELYEIISKGTFDSDNKVRRLLEDMFADSE